MLTNVWKLNDLATMSLFFIVICLRAYDIVQNEDAQKNGPCPFVYNKKCDRAVWNGDDAWPVWTSEGALAFLHLLIFIRAMELMYIDRTFGPLQLSLDKMLVDTIRFLTVFCISFLAFACVMTQLYWGYGKVSKLIGVEQKSYVYV